MDYVIHELTCSYCYEKINSRRSIGESLDMLRNHIRAKHEKQLDDQGADYTYDETGK